MPVLSSYPDRVLTKLTGVDSGGQVGMSDPSNITSQFNIVTYGARTDIADNSGAIQDTIDAAIVGGGLVTAPAGRYQMGHGVTVPDASGNIVILDFPGSTFFMQDDSTGTLFTFQNQFGQFKNCKVAHFGSGGIDDCIAMDGSHGFFCENLNLTGEFGSVANGCRLTDTSDDVFINCTFEFAASNGVFCDGPAQFLVFVKGSLFACDVGFRSDTTQLQNPFFLEVVSAECVTADYQINGAVGPTWLNCDIEGIAGSPGVGKAFNFYSDPIVAATIQNCFFAHRNETIQNTQHSSFIHNGLYNENIVFDGTNLDFECHDNFVVSGSGAAGITASATGILLVSQLPPIAEVAPGTRKMVSDATATTFNSVVAGSGGNKIPVISDGTNWLIG